MSESLSPNAAALLDVVRRANGAAVTTEGARQDAGLSYEQGLDALLELLEANVVEVQGDDELEVVYLSLRKGAA